jgi:hypothetical protein
MHPRDRNDLEGVGGNKVFDRGVASGRGLPHEKCLNLERYRKEKKNDTGKTVDP